MDELIMTQESFDRLWARVQGAAPPVPSAPRPEEMLRRFLDETGETLLLERSLTQVCGAPMAAVCRETRRRYLRLQTAYFLHTGCRAALPSVCRLREPPLCLLRKLWLAARARAAAYEDAPAATDELRELYRDLAESERTHARQLEGIISRFLG